MRIYLIITLTKQHYDYKLTITLYNDQYSGVKRCKMKIDTRKEGFTKLSSEIVPQNKELPGTVQSGIHLAESCRPSGRTE